MDVRRLVRGTVPWTDIERIGEHLRARRNRESIRLAFLEADNWLSTPCVVDEAWFVKIISPQNAMVHALFTEFRNVGAFTAGGGGFFERFDSPFEMARHELAATKTLQSAGVNVPEPVEAFEVDGYGVLVLQYLPDFRTLDEHDPAQLERWSRSLFRSLRQMHDHELVHGDLRAENVLIHEENLYFIDVTNVNDNGFEHAVAYDLASALATLAPALGSREVLDIAREYYSIEEMLAAREFLDFVRVRPDHDFDATKVKSEIENRAGRR